MSDKLCRLLDAILGSDALLDDPPLQQARDELRAFIRGIAATRTFDGLVARWRSKGFEPPNPDGLPDAWRASLAALRSLRRSLESHADRFRKDVPYHRIFDFAASDIGGWRN